MTVTAPTVPQLVGSVLENVETVILGKRRQVEYLLVALLCRGHVLLEDVPGTGKTMLARAVAVSIGLSFKRLQCTPDLLPSAFVDPGGGLRLPGILRASRRNLSPREQIQRYYADAVQNASRHGIDRHPAQTPNTYLPCLEASLPESGDAPAALTAAYIEARYSPHPIDDE